MTQTLSAAGIYRPMRALGYRLFGPLVAPFLLDVSDRLVARPRPTLFLMREGYHLSSLFDHVLRARGFEHVRASVKTLDVSRAFLYKLMLDDPALINYALGHHYSGTIETLLRDRFALTERQLGRIGQVPRVTIRLPDSIPDLAHLLSDLTKPIHSEIAEKRELYRRYLRSVALGDEFTCVDIGFAGSTQVALHALFGHSIHGCYMYLSPKFRAAPGLTAEGLISSTAGHGDGDPLVDCSLVLEAIFTSPDAQLVDVEAMPSGEMRRVRGRPTAVQDDFHVTCAVVDGVRDFIDAMLQQGVQSCDLASLLDRGRTYFSLLRYDQSAEMRSLRAIARVDDHVSGLAVLDPFRSLPSLSHANGR